MWNYVYYMYYLKRKDSNNYNGIESSVSDRIQALDVGWFPLMKAMSLT